MHTLIVIGGGMAALVACLLLGHAWGGGLSGAAAGARLFVPLWLVGAFANMWIGTTHGYSWGEEFPIFLGVFALPAAIAALLAWRLA